MDIFIGNGIDRLAVPLLVSLVAVFDAFEWSFSLFSLFGFDCKDGNTDDGKSEEVKDITEYVDFLLFTD